MSGQAVFLVWCECPCGATRIGQMEGQIFATCSVCGQYATVVRDGDEVGVSGVLTNEREAMRAARDGGYAYAGSIHRAYDRGRLRDRSAEIAQAKVESYFYGSPEITCVRPDYWGSW